MSLNPADTATAPAGRAYYTVASAAERLEVGERTIYELIASGQLRTVRVARRPGARGVHRIPAEYMAEYEARLRDG